MKHSDAINELAAALSKAQKQFESAERAHVAKVTSKKGEGSSYSFNYADLAAYLDVCRGPLGDNGLSFVQEPTCDGNVVSVTTLLMHSSGQWIESEPLKLTLTGEALTPQVIGSGITYARRYSLSALTGMASEQDDDGNAASGNSATTGPREAMPPCPKCNSPKSVIKSRFDDADYVCFKGKSGCGEKWFTPEPGTEAGGTMEKPDPPAAVTKPVATKPALSKLDQTEIDNLKAALKKELFDPQKIPQADRIKHADAFVQFVAGKSWDEIAKVPGLAAQVKEKVFASFDAGESWESIYTAAKLKAGLASQLEQEMAGAA